MIKDVQDFKAILDIFDVKSKSIEHADDASLRRFKDKWLFIITLIAIIFVFIICGVFLALEQYSPYRGIALNGVIGLALALSGYYVRGK